MCGRNRDNWRGRSGRVSKGTLSCLSLGIIRSYPTLFIISPSVPLRVDYYFEEEVLNRAGCTLLQSKKRWKQVTYNEDGTVRECLFCKIATRTAAPTETVPFAENSLGTLAAFYPRTPSAATHILVAPKQHIRSVLQLSERPLLEEMLRFGTELLSADIAKREDSAANTTEARFVFHVPPMTTVDHLHLHCLAPPFKGPLTDTLYTPDTAWCMSAATKLASL